ncbi:MAG: SGNH/GDSL hydrolase family protein, partial [Gammaproteobacteria bacterium]|nr:SGNH/GDSL hydrolase family protein [Gammaproteobacteria bacterium]
ARTGETTATALKALLVSDARSFDVAVTSLGVNDAIALVSRRRWRQRQAELRQLLRDRFGVQYLLISGLPPVDRFPALPQPLRWHFGGRASQLNADLAADVRNEPDCRFIDLRITDDVSGMASDGFHPGPDIYAQWGRTVAQTIIDLYR